jgi:hypothetical protein
MKIGDINSKDDLLGHLTSIRIAAIYDIFAQICLHEFFKKANRGGVDLNVLKTKLPEGVISLKEFVEQVNKIAPKALVETKRNANRALTRNLIKEIFRITKAYCKKANQSLKISNQSWYQFARITTNCISHSFRLEFNLYDKRQLPVVYNGITIDEAMEGQPIKMPLQILINLVDDIIKFVKEEVA